MRFCADAADPVRARSGRFLTPGDRCRETVAGTRGHVVLPRWLGWLSLGVGLLFFLQGFGLGGVIASFGVVLDLIGFVLFLIFVLVSGVILIRRDDASFTAW